MIETFRRAHDHPGASFVEVYQNCNVFNDGAFDAITAKDRRADMLIPLEHGQPIRFGAEGEHGVAADGQGRLRLVEVAEVGEDALVVHDEHRPNPSLAFALSRLAIGPHEPTPIGVFRAVERPDYGGLVDQQLLEAQNRKGPGDLSALLRSGATWIYE
jgi:2-oxoglutarate ferredoxin oxidoreductase subunit beta